jgi:O-succinylbenzoate synthase
MIIKKINFAHFSLRLKTPFMSSKQIIDKREGYILSLTDELGNTGLGECSPLPEFSSELLEQSYKDLNDLKSKLYNVQFTDKLFAIGNQFSVYNLSPSVHFAFEQAMLSLLINRNRSKNILHENFGELNSEININTVISIDTLENIETRIREKIKDGYNKFKVKIGRNKFEDDYELIKRIREKFGNGINIKLDASGKWNLEAAKNYLQRLSVFNIQYIEEPCSGFNTLCMLAHNSPIPIAVDESIRSIANAISVINDSNIKFIVLKPMILGGIISSFQLIKTAEGKNKSVVISSSFESAIGKSALVLLAACTNHNIAHGLGTSELLRQDICTDYYSVKSGKIKFAHENYPPQFNLKFT